MRILVVEDNPKMSGFIRQGLTELGYTVEITAKGYEGEELAATGEFDMIVLDVMLPDVDGIQVCRNLRRRGVKSLILMLTALSSTNDKVSGFDAGADDYLTKPFDFDELVARVRALLRRGQPHEGMVLKFADVEMDLVGHKVSRAGQKIKLSAKEYALLEHFMRNPNRVLTRASIGEHVWDMNFAQESNVIDVYVGMLRRKIDRDFEPKLIHTVIGRGYMLSAEAPDA